MCTSMFLQRDGRERGERGRKRGSVNVPEADVIFLKDFFVVAVDVDHFKSLY